MTAKEARDRLNNLPAHQVSKAFKMSLSQARRLLLLAISGFADDYELTSCGCTKLVDDKIKKELS